MRRASLLAMVVALLVALCAGVAVAKSFSGNNQPNTIKGTNQADTIKGNGGNDSLFGRGGSDKLYGGSGNDVLRGQIGSDRIVGGTGNDRIYGNTGRDALYGGSGDDYIAARGDGVDRVFCGPGFDVANVSLNDLLGGSSVEDVLSDVTGADQVPLSCEVLVVEGLRVPLGAIVDLPAPLEADVSRLLESYLRDGSLSAEEITNLREVFSLIERGLLEELDILLDDLLGGPIG